MLRGIISGITNITKMKIQKIALSLFAIAISSSAFASAPSSDTQDNSEKIEYAFMNFQSPYDIVSGVAGANVYAGASSDDQSEIEFTSAQKEFLVKNIILPIRAAGCEQSFRALGNGRSDAETFNNLPAEASDLSLKSLAAIKASLLMASCSFINPETHKIEMLGLQRDDTKTVLGYKATLADQYRGRAVAVTLADLYSKLILKKISKEDFDATVSVLEHRDESAKNFDLGAAISKILTPDQNLLLEFQANTPVYDGAIKVAAEFKAQENAKVISEFNVLQQLAVKESDPTVKALIKQAADLKLAGYRK